MVVDVGSHGPHSLQQIAHGIVHLPSCCLVEQLVDVLDAMGSMLPVYGRNKTHRGDGFNDSMRVKPCQRKLRADYFTNVQLSIRIGPLQCHRGSSLPV